MAKKVTVQSVVRDVMGPGFWVNKPLVTSFFGNNSSKCYNDARHKLKTRKTERRYKFVDVNVTKADGLDEKLKTEINAAGIDMDRPGFVCTEVHIYSNEVHVYTSEDLQMPEPEPDV